jgi:GT2 family glycosyltransferase
MGAMACDADIYAFLNAHVTIDKASVNQCASAFDMADVGIASPYVYHPIKKIPAKDWGYARCTRTYSRILHLPIAIPFSGDHDFGSEDSTELIENDWASGGTLFCRKKVIKDIGWDGSYFLVYEDVDISIRAKKSGWRVVTTPPAIAFHSGESTRTSTASAYYNVRNSLWFARRYHSRRVQILLTTYLSFLLCRVAAADALKRRQPPRAAAAARGLRDGWFLWPRSFEALPTEPLWFRDASGNQV